MILPTDQSRDRFSLLDTRALKNPVLRHRANPIPTSVDRLDIPGTHQKTFVRPPLGKRTVLFGSRLGDRSVGPIRSTPKKNAVSTAIKTVAKRRYPTNTVAREEQQADPLIPHRLDRSELANIPVLIMPYTDKGFRFEPPVRRQHIAVATVRNIIALLLKPKGQRELKRQILPGTLRQRIVDHTIKLRLASIRAIKTHVSPRPLIPLRMGVDRVLARPGIVSLPSVVRTLKQNIARPIVDDDKDDIALPIRLLVRFGNRSQTPKIHPRYPFVGYRQTMTRFPSAFVEIFFTELRCHLSLALNRTDLGHQPSPRAIVISSPENFELKRPCRLGRNINVDRLSCTHTLSRTITLNPRRAISARVDPHSGQLPISTSSLEILRLDQILRSHFLGGDKGTPSQAKQAHRSRENVHGFGLTSISL